VPIASEQTGQAIVLIDDDEAARLSIGQMLRLRKHRVEVFSSAEAALAWPGLPEADCIICDIKMPGMGGEEFLAEVQRRNFPPPLVMITGHGDIALAVRCLRAGAYDFVEKPFEDDVLLAAVARSREKSTLRREGEDLKRRLKMLSPEEDGRFGMVGRSRSMQDLYAEIGVVAKADAPVLVHGETGAGKELVARAIHAQGPRAAGPFVVVNAGALPETMLESELFGHTKGAFTGAEARREGKLAAASGGTLLLDEVESISLQAQIKLLRVLEDKLVYPLGQDQPVKIDVRFLATTKSNLQDGVRQGTIREDFYHRIVVLSVAVPPLRDRSDDIPLLIAHFLKAAAGRSGIPIPEVPERTLGLLMRHTWPGNVRELKAAVERMVITSSKGIAGSFTQDELVDSLRLLSVPAAPGRLRDELERTEKVVIESVLRENQGEIAVTALALGISRRALYERMKRYGLNKEDFKA
jgi:two-component system C4-dicarboxylate transport response regulator DctD